MSELSHCLGCGEWFDRDDMHWVDVGGGLQSLQCPGCNVTDDPAIDEARQSIDIRVRRVEIPSSRHWWQRWFWRVPNTGQGATDDLEGFTLTRRGAVREIAFGWELLGSPSMVDFEFDLERVR